MNESLTTVFLEQSLATAGPKEMSNYESNVMNNDFFF